MLCAVRIGLRTKPVLRDRLFGVVLVAALLHGGYLVYPHPFFFCSIVFLCYFPLFFLSPFCLLPYPIYPIFPILRGYLALFLDGILPLSLTVVFPLVVIFNLFNAVLIFMMLKANKVVWFTSQLFLQVECFQNLIEAIISQLKTLALEGEIILLNWFDQESSMIDMILPG